MMEATYYWELINNRHRPLLIISNQFPDQSLRNDSPPSKHHYQSSLTDHKPTSSHYIPYYCVLSIPILSHHDLVPTLTKINEFINHYLAMVGF